MKNYIALINDHSGSMASLATAACADYNANIAAIRDSASREMLDTVVSVGEASDYTPKLSVTVSNPHVLRKLSYWRAAGGTPLWRTTSAMLAMLSNLPDANKDDVSFLVALTTDGEDTDGEAALNELKTRMAPLIATGRWTFVARVPANARQHILDQFTLLGFAQGNIQKWQTTSAGMVASTQATTAAMSSFFSLRSTGARSTGAFYANAGAVNLAALEDISKKVSLYVVPDVDNGIEIRPFVLRYRMDYLKGSAFYQLTKTESKVSHTKLVAVRERATGKIYSGPQARGMIGLPTDRNARLHPGDHKNYDIFIQSESVNRKLVGGTGILYWKEIGKPFTEADLAYLKPKDSATTAAPVQLPAVPVSTRPTPSPIPKAKREHRFKTREQARRHCAMVKVPQSKIRSLEPAIDGNKWAV